MHKKRNFKFGTKNVLFAFCPAGIWKNYCHVELSTLEFFQMPRFAENKKSSNIGAKMHYLGIFKVALEKNTVMFDAGTPTFFSECKLSCNTKEL